MINNKPNIFEYATKELSQDAVFMYLFDCYNSECKEESELGERFLHLIYDTQNKKIEKNVRKLIIKKQYHNIDVLVLVEYEDNSVDAIIIEDKTYSSEHDNQLKRYYDDIKKDGVDGRIASNIYGVYFKLGQLTVDEEKALEIYDGIFRYENLDYDAFLDFLERYQNTNLIMQLIYEFYDERMSNIRLIDKTEDFSNPAGLEFDTVLSDWYSQNTYFGWIIKKVIQNHYHPENQYGVMNYGRPCTQYRFVFTEEDKNSNWDCKTENNISKYSYFFRIDSNSKGWYIAINQYEGNGDRNWDEKKQDRDIIRDNIKDIIKQNGVIDNSDNRGKKESKICLFTIKSFDDVVKLIPVLEKIHDIVLQFAVK